VSSPALSFRDVAVRAGERDILHGVDLDVPRGEIVTLAGANGAGKTTLLRAASRVLAPWRGSIHVDGRDVAGLSRRRLAQQMAVVPQDAAVSFPFRVEEVVLMGRSPHLGVFGFEDAADVEKAAAAMETVGISHLAHRSLLELSGGERQLVLVARAIAQEARLLLLDEPTAHLDLRHRVDVLSVVEGFVAGGGSALVVSHDLTLAARRSHRVALLVDGRILASGPPAEVLTPAALRSAFGVEAEVLHDTTGAPVVVPQSVLAPGDRTGNAG
jgi:iron complex transport system ATP-binding protein